MKYEVITNVKQEIEIDYQQVLKMLIALNKENRKLHKEYQSFYPVTEYIMWYGTISLDIGRAIGKTNFIKENAKSNDLILIYSLRDINIWQHNCPYATVICPNKNNISQLFYHGRRFDTIWVDEPELVFSNISINDVMKRFVVDYGQTVIMLGRYVF